MLAELDGADVRRSPPGEPAADLSRLLRTGGAVGVSPSIEDSRIFEEAVAAQVRGGAGRIRRDPRVRHRQLRSGTGLRYSVAAEQFRLGAGLMWGVRLSPRPSGLGDNHDARA